MFPSLTGDLKQISKCWLYRDPRVSRRARLHTFCLECKATSTITKDDSCSLCRSFFRIPEQGCGSIPRNYFMEKLIDLHEAHLERELKLKGEKKIDIPLVEQFEFKDAGLPFVFLAWLDNKLYIAHDGESRIRVFADRAPFEELEETIEIDGLRSLCGMTASAATRSIFVCDRTKTFIWKIQVPEKELSLLEASGTPSDLSITPDGDLLAEVTGMDESDSCQLNVFELANSSRTVILLPSEIRQIFSIVQTQNQNFILFHCSRLQRRYLLCILSNDGQKFIKTVYSPTLTEPNLYGFKSVRFAVKDDGQIFAIDMCHNRVLLFNSDLTGCRILSIDNNDHIIFNIFSRIVYVREKQQLLLNGLESTSPSQLGDLIYVFHLSPCNNINEAQQPMN